MSMNDLERRKAYGGPLASDEILRMMNNPPSTEPIIIAGKRFGKLTPLFPTERTGNRGSTLWVCRCACGRQTLAAYEDIVSGELTSCGCAMDTKRAPEDLSGKWFGMLRVVRPENPARLDRYVCFCECGRTVSRSVGDLVSGETRSCGCIEKSLEPGGPDLSMCSHHPLRGVWSVMRSRAKTKRENAGGEVPKGYGIWPAWTESYKAFYAWAYTTGWRPGLMLCKRVAEEDYTPDNCYWGSRADNAKARHTYRKRAPRVCDATIAPMEPRAPV